MQLTEPPKHAERNKPVSPTCTQRNEPMSPTHVKQWTSAICTSGMNEQLPSTHLQNAMKQCHLELQNAINQANYICKTQ